MPQEKSAGAIIFRMAPVKSAEGGVPPKAGQFDGVNKMVPYYLLLHYHSGHWDFPRGHIEQGESVEETVKREVQEETGIKDLRITPGFKGYTKFFFKKVHHLPKEERQNAPWTVKIITLLVAETKTEKIIISSEQKGFSWFVYKDALKKLAPHAKKVFTKANEFIVSGKSI